MGGQRIHSTDCVLPYLLQSVTHFAHGGPPWGFPVEARGCERAEELEGGDVVTAVHSGVRNLDTPLRLHVRHGLDQTRRVLPFSSKHRSAFVRMVLTRKGVLVDTASHNGGRRVQFKVASSR